MKSAIGYIRISTKDQSNFSLSGQQEYIDNFCQREEIQLLETFKDDGFSAKSFDRPSWKELKTFIQKHHREINYLIVCKYDRFSRNAGEGLNMIETLEKKFNIVVLSVMERLLVEPGSPYFFKSRADMLVNAEFELHVIKERTKFGFNQSAASGHYPYRAPYGYKNIRDKNKKPTLEIDHDKEPIVKFIFDNFLRGMPIKELGKAARQMGFTKSGNSAIRRILTCPAYAGLVKVQPYKGQRERLVEAIHPAIIPAYCYYEVQKKLTNKGPRTILTEKMPLRGLLLCECGKPFSGGKSKGRNQYYWYYRCVGHEGHNYSAIKIHDKFDLLLKEMNLPNKHLKYLKEAFERKFQERMSEKTKILQRIKRQLSEVERKMESIEDKFISNKITERVYKRWSRKLEPERLSYLQQISKWSESDKVYYNRFQAQLPKLGDIHHIYHSANLPEKRELIKLWFERTLTWEGSHFETIYILPVFAPNLLKMKEKDILYIKNNMKYIQKTERSTPYTPSFESFDNFFAIIEKISA